MTQSPLSPIFSPTLDGRRVKDADTNETKIMKTHTELKTEAAATLKATGVKKATIKKAGYNGITITIHNRETTPAAVKALLTNLDTFTIDPFHGADYGSGQSIRVEYSRAILDELETEFAPVAAQIAAHLDGSEGNPFKTFNLPHWGRVDVSRANRFNPAHADINGKTCGLGHPGTPAADIAWLLARGLGIA